MDFSKGNEGPAVLQLQKWGPNVHLNVSQFREAFISPTRELLLLLSYQCEAMLLPLGEAKDCVETNSSLANEQIPSSASTSLEELSAADRSDSKVNISSTSESIKMVFNDNIPSDNNYSNSNNHPYICDVHSLAWGICEETYSRQDTASVRDLLFVSGNNGVTVHVFCRPSKVSEVTKPAMEGEHGQGVWVEWGPTISPACNMTAEESSSLHVETSGGVIEESKTNGTAQTLESLSLDAGEDGKSKTISRKRWLRTFLTKPEMLKSEGIIFTMLPEMSLLPSTAMIISFNLFGSDSQLSQSRNDSKPVSCRDGKQNDSVLDVLSYAYTPSDSSSSSTVVSPDALLNFLTGSISSSYVCSTVFSSNSHHLIGFALTLVDPIPVGLSDTCERDEEKIVIVVARIVSCGIQWVCLARLADILDKGPNAEWTDFKFSDDFLICLNAVGLIYFYRATTGEYVAHLDLLHSNALTPQFTYKDCEKFRKLDETPTSTDIECEINGIQSFRDFAGKRKFRRLLVASHTTLLAVTDVHGVVYVICAGNHLQGKNDMFNKSLKSFQDLGLGTLVGWEVGGADVGCQRMFSDTCPSLLSANKYSFLGKLRYNDSLLSGFSVGSQTVETEYPSSSFPHATRKLFLPTQRSEEGSVLCFSPFGIMRLVKERNKGRSSRIVCSSLHVGSATLNDLNLNSKGWGISVGEAVGCTYEGCFYLVTEDGLSVVLPSISVSSSFFPVEAIGHRQKSVSTATASQAGILFESKGIKQQSFLPWKIELLDRLLLYEDSGEADRLCMENGWDLKISRIRRLQLALDYLKFDEIEISLEKLVDVNLAEEGVLRLLFLAAYLMFDKISNDNEVTAASRILALATCFVTKMIRKYGLLQHRSDDFTIWCVNRGEGCHLPLLLENEYNEKEYKELGNFRRLQEMAHFLEIIRNLQSRLNSKIKRPAQSLVDALDASNLLDTDLSRDESELSILPTNVLSYEKLNQHQLPFPESDSESRGVKKQASMSTDPLETRTHINSEQTSGSTGFGSDIVVSERKVLPLENTKDMIARWEVDKLDQRNVVEDALLSGRLPLAVLKLHLHRLHNIIGDKEPHDTFSEVRDIGRAIAYDLFLKGETGLAVATLQKLGEDIELCLRQLTFGTLRRSLRLQIAAEMTKYGFIGPYEGDILERISLIERVYPCSNFWRTYCGRKEVFFPIFNINSPEEISLHLLHSAVDNIVIVCGEVDGAVLGTWNDVSEHPVVPVLDDDSAHSCYWAGAAVWSDAWDQRTVDRIVLDQPFLMGVNVSWESQIEYHICHSDWVEVSELLDIIPSYLFSNGTIRVSLDGFHPTSAVGYSTEFSKYNSYISSIEELDAVCMDIPDIKVIRFSAYNMCSTWMRALVDQRLSRRLIFPKEYWEGTAEIVRLLARSGYMTSTYETSSLDDSIEGSSDLNILSVSGTVHPGAAQALHKVVLHNCAQYKLPNLLDLYLDHHKLALDDTSLSVFQDAVGDDQRDKWLLFLRVEGHEYDASFANARLIASKNLVPGNSLGVCEIDDIIRTLDDIAEGGGEIAALATLMYAPIPFEDCLCSGSVMRHSSSSAQCTLENLRPALQRFPTLWRMLVTACFGQDPTCNYLNPKTKEFVSSQLSDYLNWRDSIFFSSGHDTSLLQMLPSWFSKSVRRLIQLYVQGPLGCQSLSGLPRGETLPVKDIDYLVNANEKVEISAMTWETAIQKHVEKEFYASSTEESGLGLEHHLHRGRALAAFNHLLSIRVQKLNPKNIQKVQSESSVHGQTNVQSNVHTLLAPITQSEEPILASVMPLALMHFQDSSLVASCAFLLELCGLSAYMLRIDIAALRRISSFYKSNAHFDYIQLLPKGLAYDSKLPEDDIAYSLGRVLADDYVNHDSAGIMYKNEGIGSITTKRPSRALMLVQQHLEKASLPLLTDGMTCGSWLLSGNGDGAELRSQQKDASLYWSLVTTFCRVHQIPLSTNYLALLARDNDWVGFLSEAQIGGYPFDTVIEVASKEFNDNRLKLHILTVLKGMQSRKKVTSLSNSDVTEERSISVEGDVYTPVEVFGIIAECEKKKNPGEALLLKAKDLCWSILAMIASCFPDVSPLSCLTVWLEITAARETSSIKVNDVASKIANNVGAAVEATNATLVASGELAYHYNRRNPKRRRIIDAVDHLMSKVSDVSISTRSERIIAAQGNVAGDDGKNQTGDLSSMSNDTAKPSVSLSRMVALLCEQHLFLPLLRAFEMFLPSCSLLPFIRALQAFSQMRLSDASAHIGSFSARIKEEQMHVHMNNGTDGQNGTAWISSTAVKAADAMLSKCPSPYEKRCLLQLLSSADFGDGGSAAVNYKRNYWKINLAEPLLREDDGSHLGDDIQDDGSLLRALEENGHWEEARNWAMQLEASGGQWKSIGHHVTETQAESMVAEWKEFLWDVPEERVALWAHCQTLFIRYAFPPLQAGCFFLKHAEAVEKDLPARELHELLLLSLQWLSGMITQSDPAYPLHLLREIETRVWLLAVESEAQIKSDGDFSLSTSSNEPGSGKSSNIIECTACLIAKMDSHINAIRIKSTESNDTREISHTHQKIPQLTDDNISNSSNGGMKAKKRAKAFLSSKRQILDVLEKNTDSEESSISLDFRKDLHLQDENLKLDSSFSRWEERVGPAELERAVLSLLEFGQITAAKQLQQKLSPGQIPSEFVLVDAALKLAAISTPSTSVSMSMLDDELSSIIQSHKLLNDDPYIVYPLQVLENLATSFTEGRGYGLCKRIISIVKAANVLGVPFSEAYDKQPIELLQLLSLKAQDSFDEANLLVQTHTMPAASIAHILAESFLKGLLAAHRGGYMDSQKEEGPAPLLWRFSDFLKWANLCPSEPEIGHALMRLVITGQEIPHACEVELLILSHHFYKSSACLDGVDVLVALAATRVEAYVLEGDFSCLARLITGVGNFHALNFILGILIENGQLDLLLQKYSAAADSNSSTAEAVRGFRMAVLTSLKQFNLNDLDAFAMVYNHFDMKHETASLLESRAQQSSQQWFYRYDKDQNEDLLESMRYYIEAAEVHSSIDAGNKTHAACSRASLVSLQIRMPDFKWLNLSETNARRALVEQSRFQEALIVAEAYGLNQPSEWALVLWNQMLKPELTEQFVAEFVAVLPLHPMMLAELARFYRAEVAARGDQSQFSVWLTGGGLPAEWAKYLERSFRCLLKRTRDLKLRLQLATIATGFTDVIDALTKVLDRVPENAGPLVLRKGHGGAYLPLM